MQTLERKIASCINAYKGPCLIYDMAALKKKMDFLVSASESTAVKFLFTVKSFPSKDVLTMASKIMPGFEVSNLNEYKLLPKHSEKNYLSINDPLGRLSDRLPRQLYQNHRCYVNIDNASLESIQNLPDVKNVAYGLRVAHTSIREKSCPYPCGTERSRFGTPLENLAVFKACFATGKISGLNLHNGSEENTFDTYIHMLDELFYTLKKEDIAVSFLNLGGGLHHLSEQEIERLVATVDKKIHKTNILCFFEPGLTIAKGSGYAITKILSIKKINESTYGLIVDISSECHLKWSDEPTLLTRDVSDRGARKIDVLIGGPTCYEHDFIGAFKVSLSDDSLPFKKGQIITLGNINGYSAAWNVSFNGISKAKISYV